MRFSVPPMDLDLLDAWDELHAANDSLHWFVGQPACEPRLAVLSSQYAFHPRETPKVGHRSREWTAIGPTEARVVRAMARCLATIRNGGLPR